MSMIAAMSRDRRLRQALRHRLPVALHEDEGDDRLQQDHRRDDDDQRAGVEPLRHVARDEPPEPVPVLASATLTGSCANARRRPVGDPRPRAAHRLVNRAGEARVSRPPASACLGSCRKPPSSFLRRRHRCRRMPASLFHAQPIANAAHGLQPDRVGRIALDLAAQPVDLHVDGALADLGFAADQLVARDGLAGARGEDRQDLLLAVGQLQRLAAPLQLAPRDLEGVGAEDELLDLGRRLPGRRGAGCC